MTLLPSEFEGLDPRDQLRAALALSASHGQWYDPQVRDAEVAAAEKRIRDTTRDVVAESMIRNVHIEHEAEVDILRNRATMRDHLKVMVQAKVGLDQALLRARDFGDVEFEGRTEISMVNALAQVDLMLHAIHDMLPVD